MAEIKDKLRSALIALGVKKNAKISAKMSGDRIFLIVNGEHFGVWDVAKSTFVD